MRPTILLIEDEHDLCHAISRQLGSKLDAAGCDMAIFHDNHSASQFVRENPSRIVGYIQDLSRPHLPGEMADISAGIRFYETIITQFTPRAKTIISSADIQSAYRYSGFSPGRVKYLSKVEPSFVDEMESLIPWLVEEEEDLKDEATEDQEAVVSLIELISIPWEEIAARIAKKPSTLDLLDSRKFEALVAEIFKSHGWTTELTAKTRDGGYDIIAIRNDRFLDTKILIEAKRWSPNRPVGVNIVRSLYGLRATESFSQVVLATSSYVSAPAKRAFHRQIPWELSFVERDAILKWCRQYGKIGVQGEHLILPPERFQRFRD